MVLVVSTPTKSRQYGTRPEDVATTGWKENQGGNKPSVFDLYGVQQSDVVILPEDCREEHPIWKQSKALLNNYFII